MPDFSRLARFAARRFVPDAFNPADWSQLETLYDQLIEQNLATPDALEKYLRDWNELDDVVTEEYNRRYANMTCQTDDVAAAEAYKFFVTDIVPQLKPRENELEKHYLASPARSTLASNRYAVFDRQVAARAALFREANVPLETQDDLLAQAYQTLMGSLTVTFDDKECTLPQLFPVLEETDRARRETAWRAMQGRRYYERDRIDHIFDQMLALRMQMATNAGYANYRDYMHARKLRFDYTPADCYTYHAAIEQHAVPLLKKIQARRRAQMGLRTLRPWDTAVDPLGRPPLRPYKQARELIEGCARIFEKVDPPLAAQFEQMDELGMLDLENRKGKAPGGYQEFLPESRMAFIFMNAVNSHGDVETLLHEGGHAFNSFATRDEWLSAYRTPPMEFCEVASMAMELLGAEHFTEFYASGDAARARSVHLEGSVSVLCWVATVDAFQHWLYLHPKHTRAARTAAWIQTYQRFAGDLHWTEFEHFMGTLWHRQLHIFEMPFYYIEYGIAQLGALQVWRNARRDRNAAVTAYERALALGGSQPLPDIYAAADIRFDFSAQTVAPLMELIAQELTL
jgi:oligoendopeptidase F